MKKKITNDEGSISIQMEKMPEGSETQTISVDKAVGIVRDFYANTAELGEPKAVCCILVNEGDTSVRLEGDLTRVELAGAAMTLIDSIDAAFPGTWQAIIEYKLAGN